MKKLIAIGGHTGTGKTTLAYALKSGVAELASALIVEDDQMRREILAKSLIEKLKNEDYQPDVTVRVREKLDAKIEKTLEEGGIVIDSSGFFKKEQRLGIEALAERCGAPFIGFWLVAPRSVMEARIEKRTQEREGGGALSFEQGHASDACVGVIDKYGELGLPSSGLWTVLDSDAPVEKLVELAAARLREGALKKEATP